jgi:hypothetical protein
MKKLLILFYFTLFTIALSAQPITFIKKVTNNNLENSSDLVLQGQNGQYYMSYSSKNSSTNFNRKVIIHFDDLGNKIDSIKADTLLNKPNDIIMPISKLKNNFLFYASPGDSLHHYFYVRVFDQNLQTITEKIIDTLAPNQWILYHIENKKGNHVFLSVKNDSASIWSYILYETDSNLNLINKANTNFKWEGYTSSFVEIPSDSSYLITTRYGILKTDYNFSYFDTVFYPSQSGNWFTWCKTKKFNDSLYFETALTGGTMQYSYPGFYVRTKNAAIVDTFSFPINSERNDITQVIDFMDYISPDTIFYCSGAYSIDPFSQANSGIMIAKFNMNKTIYWQKYYGFDGNYLSGSIQATQDGGCILQWDYWDWVMNPTNYYSHNLVIIKTDKYGNAPTIINENITISDKQILVYPNPANNIINFETGLYDKLQLQIYNINGQLQTEKVLMQGNNNIDIGNYSNRMYFYRIMYHEKFLESGKFVKD